MTRKIYRTASGKQVDLGALQLKHEDVRAVGNMNVNARGDTINEWNQPLEKKSTSVARNYNRQLGNVKDAPVTKTPQKEAASRRAKTAKNVSNTKKTVEDGTDTQSADKDIQQPITENQPVTSTTSTGGLAAAIARARTIREQPVQNHSDLVKKSPGIQRI